MVDYPFESLKMMSRIGAMASELGLHEPAKAILGCLVALRPESPFPSISLALAVSRSGAPRDALAQLREISKKFPDCDMARVLLAIHLDVLKEPGAPQLIEAVLQHGSDPEALNLARSVAEDVCRKPAMPGPADGLRATRPRHYTHIHSSETP